MFDWTETWGGSKSSIDHRFNRPGIPKQKPNRFNLEELDAIPAAKKSEYWFPQETTPWFYLSSYSRLSEPVRRRYNQLYALGTHEAFVALEMDFIYPIFRELTAQKDIDPELKAMIDSFAEEEKKHAQMFVRVNRRSEPLLYQDSNYYLMTLGGKDLAGYMRSIAKRFRFFGVWVWVALFFEERSLMYSKAFMRDKSPNIAPLFRETHRLHMLEELYHVQADAVLIDRYYRPLGRFKRWLAAVMLGRIVGSYLSPKKLSVQIAQVLNEEFPGENVGIAEVMRELPSLKTNRRFHRRSLGPDATRRVLQQLQLFPEMAGIAARLKTHGY